jgi:hypothetical protein
MQKKTKIAVFLTCLFDDILNIQPIQRQDGMINDCGAVFLFGL